MKRVGWIFLLAVLLPVLALAALALRAAKNERAFLERQQEESARAQVALIVSDAEAELAEIRQEFQAIYREVDFASNDAAAIESGCRVFKKNHPFARLIFVLDRDGTILWTFAPPSKPSEQFVRVELGAAGPLAFPALQDAGFGTFSLAVTNGTTTIATVHFDLSTNPTALGEALRVLSQQSNPTVALLLGGSTLSFVGRFLNDAIIPAPNAGLAADSGFGFDHRTAQGSMFTNSGMILANDSRDGSAVINAPSGIVANAAGGAMIVNNSGSISFPSLPAVPRAQLATGRVAVFNGGTLIVAGNAGGGSGLVVSANGTVIGNYGLRARHSFIQALEVSTISVAQSSAPLALNNLALDFRVVAAAQPAGAQIPNSGAVILEAPAPLIVVGKPLPIGATLTSEGRSNEGQKSEPDLKRIEEPPNQADYDFKKTAEPVPAPVARPAPTPSLRAIAPSTPPAQDPTQRQQTQQLGLTRSFHDAPQQQQQQAQQQQISEEAQRFREREQGFFGNRDTITAYLRAEQAKTPSQSSSKLASKPLPQPQNKDFIPHDEQPRWKEKPAPPAAPAPPVDAQSLGRIVVELTPASATLQGSDLRNDIPHSRPVEPVARTGTEKMPSDFTQLAVPVETRLQPQLGAKVDTYNAPVVAIPASFQDFIALGQHYIPRVTDNKLSLLLYARDPDLPDRIVGCEVDLDELKARLQKRLAARGWAADVCAAILDDKIRPVALSLENFATDFRRPLVSEPLSESLPHWEAAIYATRPDRIASAAVWVSWTVALSVLTCLVVILIGLLLVWREAARERRLAQQKADFVTNVTHELQTPLANIRLFSEMLGSGGAPPEKQNQYANVLVAETERLSRLVNNVLDFAKSGEQRRRSYQMQLTDAGAFVGEVVEMQRPRLENSGFIVTTELPDASLTINADREALTLALLNLISNAEKYGGDRKEIAVRARQTGNQIEIAVLDRGIGVPASEREKIFEPFYRAHDQLNSGTSGTGLGLTLARRIARDHGGELRCVPREGGGSEFVMTLPLV